MSLKSKCYLLHYVASIAWSSADEPMAHVPKMIRRTISFARGIHYCPNYFYVFCPTSFAILRRIYVCIQISDCVETLYELPFLPSNTASETLLYKSGLDIYHWGAVLAVTGRIRGIGQKVLQTSFQRGRSSSPSYLHIIFLLSYLWEGLIKNIIIISCMNYKI
jgi:hypothetical protein